jgi:peptidyl-prolyl cis-trans isomerase B (cyclophilin B)
MRFALALAATFAPAVAFAASTGSVSGSVYEDAAAGRGGRPSVRVTLYRDGGDRRPDGRDDRLARTAATDADGHYRFEHLAAGSYWLVVDSTSVSPAAGLNDAAIKSSVWAEQVSGPAGSLCADGHGGSAPLGAAGNCVGGRRAGVADDAAKLASAEHVALATVGSVALTGLDFGFSFDVVSDVRDASEDPKSGRAQQGSLRQFLLNARAIKGENALRFVPVSAPTTGAEGARFWTVTTATALPELDDAGTTLDGAAYDRTDLSRLDTNPGTLGASRAQSGVPLEDPARPELELRLARGLSVKAPVVVRNVAIVGAGVSVAGLGELTIEDVAIGVGADGSRPGPQSLVGVAVRDHARARLARVLIVDQKMHGLLAEGEARLDAEHVEISGSGGEFREGSAATLQAGGSILSHGYFHGNLRGVVLEGSGNAVVDSVFEDNSGEGLRVRQAGNRLSRNAFFGNATAILSEATPSPACAAPILSAADAGLAGDVRLTGLACPGETVEIYKATARPAPADAPAGQALDRLEYLAAGKTEDCGVFYLTLEPLPLGTLLVAMATSSSGASSPLSAARALTLSQAPEAVVDTPEGSFVIRLLADTAPIHVRHFIETALRGGYDGTLFHRSLPGALIQGGDPLSRDQRKPERYGSGGLGLLKAEFSDRCFSRGVVGAVRCPSNCDSAGSQFFVCLTDHPELRGQYTAFGEVLSGLDVVEKISRASAEGRPMVPMKVTIRQAKAAF